MALSGTEWSLRVREIRNYRAAIMSLGRQQKVAAGFLGILPMFPLVTSAGSGIVRDGGGARTHVCSLTSRSDTCRFPASSHLAARVTQRLREGTRKHDGCTALWGASIGAELLSLRKEKIKQDSANLFTL